MLSRGMTLTLSFMLSRHCNLTVPALYPPPPSVLYTSQLHHYQLKLFSMTLTLCPSQVPLPYPPHPLFFPSSVFSSVLLHCRTLVILIAQHDPHSDLHALPLLLTFLHAHCLVHPSQLYPHHLKCSSASSISDILLLLLSLLSRLVFLLSTCASLSVLPSSLHYMLFSFCHYASRPPHSHTPTAHQHSSFSITHPHPKHLVVLPPLCTAISRPLPSTLTQPFAPSQLNSHHIAAFLPHPAISCS